MRKLLTISSIVMAASLAAPAHADVVTGLQLAFASGATWTGTVTFTDGYGKMIDTNGTMTGGPADGKQFTWTWWQGTSQSNPVDYDGDPLTNEDLLMAGVEPNWTDYIGISWFIGSPGDLPVLNLNPLPNGDYANYWRSLNAEQDVIVSGAFGSLNNVPEPGSLALGGLALLAAGAARRRRA